MYIWQVFVISNSINVNRAAWFLRLTVRLPYSPILLFLHIIMFPLLLILIPFDGSKRFPSFMAPIRSDTPIETNLLFIISRNGELSRVKRKKWRFFSKKTEHSMKKAETPGVFWRIVISVCRIACPCSNVFMTSKHRLTATDAKEKKINKISFN